MDKRKLLLLSGILIFGTLVVSAQTDINGFCSESKRINSAGMGILGGWAVANIALGAYGWINYTGQEKYFSQMNLFWNTVNLTIAGFSLYGNSQLDCSSLSVADALARQMKTEKILLINAGLDAAYIGSGFLLRYLSTRNETRHDLLKGYGNSLIIQGSFLLVFDLSFWYVLGNHRPEALNGLGFSVSPVMNGFYASFRF